MKCIPVLLSVPGLLFALVTRPVPSPIDSLGARPILVEGTKMTGGAWVVSDEQQRVWFSQDKGAHWGVVPKDSTGANGRIFHDQVISQKDGLIWRTDSGWKRMSFPAGYQDLPIYYLGEHGDRATYNQTSRAFKYYRSTDGLKTWTDWFSLDSSLVPAGNLDFFGQRAIGKIWYSIPDSGRLLGTTDGKNWTKVPYPEDFQVFLVMTDKRDSVLMLQGTSSSMFSRLQIAKSLDSGKTWSIYSAAEAGVISEQVGKNLYVSTTVSGGMGGVGTWFAYTAEGPWFELEGIESRGVFEENGVLHVVTSEGIVAIDSLSAGVYGAKKPLADFSVRRTGNGFEMDVPSAMLGRDWMLVGHDGKVLRAGTVTSNRFAVSIHSLAPIWMKLGGQVRAIPIR